MKQIINFSSSKFLALLCAFGFVVLFSACDSDDDASSNIERVSMKTLPQLDYILGDMLNLSDLVITLNKGGEDIDIPFSAFAQEGITTEPENGTVLDFSNEAITIKIGETGKGLVQAITITNEVTAMEIKTEPKTDYFYNQSLDLTDMVITFTYENGDIADLLYLDVRKDLETVPANGTAIDSNTDVSITHLATGLNIVQELNLTTFFPKSAVLVSGPTKTEYSVNEILDLSGTVIRYTQINNSEAEIGAEDFEALGITANPLNGKPISAVVTEVKVKHRLPGTEVSFPIVVNP
ncbi:hypothetical protein FPF71_15265 [Algibacter amylolyticus]|uniref:Uncharacterized protein n=1 Tax=Algibacter amylolyticus TaxID=1608400 RepID=A0A5M7B2U5_9FLAO|nr:hypothetical protein [Algibacter amylolyticus]KAA5821864.1 hypothetical protein F2B50_15265 [Algibacter amylolyticus]MBB5269338.1 hypothetical protein [Algibacter amylolyticus]TSJ73148.1 hypothetical protein FPF71_15265 [Algibacter amylolyticus]